MSSYPLTEPPLDLGPKSPFLPIGLSAAAAMLVCLALLLWYGCSWMVTSDTVWRHVGANMHAGSSGTLAVGDSGDREESNREAPSK
jgi:hypothetical protein